MRLCPTYQPPCLALPRRYTAGVRQKSNNRKAERAGLRCGFVAPCSTENKPPPRSVARVMLRLLHISQTEAEREAEVTATSAGVRQAVKPSGVVCRRCCRCAATRVLNSGRAATLSPFPFCFRLGCWLLLLIAAWLLFLLSVFACARLL